VIRLVYKPRICGLGLLAWGLSSHKEALQHLDLPTKKHLFNAMSRVRDLSYIEVYFLHSLFFLCLTSNQGEAIFDFWSVLLEARKSFHNRDKKSNTRRGRHYDLSFPFKNVLPERSKKGSLPPALSQHQVVDLMRLIRSQDGASASTVQNQVTRVAAYYRIKNPP
jgi:hypothetical protein